MGKNLLVVGNLAKDVIFGKEYYGGSAASIAINAERLGVEVGIMSVLGKDKFSSKYKRFLERNRIDISLIIDVLKEIPVCEVTSNENLVSSSQWHDHGCHPAMEKMEINKNEISRYQLIHLTSCPPLLARKLLDVKVPISYEPGPYLIEGPSRLDLEVARKSHLLFFNNEEYQIAIPDLKGLTEKNLVNQRPSMIVVTQGKKGSIVYVEKKSKPIVIPTVEPEGPIIDHTGAGDSYKAGFLCAYLQGRSARECGQIGAEMGAVCVTQRGGILPNEKIRKIRIKYKL